MTGPIEPDERPLAVVDDDSTADVDPVVERLGREIDPPGPFVRIGGAIARRLAAVTAAGPETWVTVAVVTACVVFTFSQLGPANVLSSSTPAGGDMGAHVWGPAYLRDHLLPSLRLTGWSPDWYAGFPAYHFYMVVPSLAIALGSFVVPYGVAFKLVAISGVLTLPIACWAFGRLVRLPFPAPPLLAVAGTVFLFDRSFSIYGGNIASTLAGEFAFSISLSLAIVFLGVVGRGLDDGRHRFAAALLLALVGLCHAIPMFFALAGAAIWLVMSVVRRSGFVLRVWWLISAGVVGMALTAWWILPFYLRSPHMSDMGWEKKTDFVNQLFQRQNLDPQLVDVPPIKWTLVLALLGVVLSIILKRRGGVFLLFMACALAAAFVLVPQGRLWNARLLGFWFLCLYLLAAVGVAELGRTIATLVTSDPDRPRRSVTIATAVIGALAALVMLALPLRALPNRIGVGPVSVEIGGNRADGRYHWLFLSTRDSSFVPSWARWNFTGYEGKPAYPEYHDLMTTMDEVGEVHGCGRAMWEHEEQHDRYGTPMALMLLPFWTDGCIGSMEGVYFESSGTTPFHFINQDELSWGASNPQRGLPYVPGPPDQVQFDRGIRHLQMLGVKYYMAITEQLTEFARTNTSLRQVATSGPWTIFEVTDSALVEPLRDEPVVLTGVKPAQWEKAVMPWYIDPERWSVWPAAGGPASWQRLPADATPEAIPTVPVAVTDIVVGTDTVSFDVSRTGTPVVVKVSYFPNWKVSGAEGPWRIGPNLMVVVPTSTRVELHYGTTVVEYASWAVSLGGLVGAVLLWRAGALVLPPPRSRRGSTVDPGDGDGGDDGDDLEPEDGAIGADRLGGTDARGSGPIP